MSDDSYVIDSYLQLYTCMERESGSYFNFKGDVMRSILNVQTVLAMQQDYLEIHYSSIIINEIHRHFWPPHPVFKKKLLDMT